MSTDAAASNVTPDPCDVAIGALLLQATSQWAVVADDKLTHTLKTALRLLIHAGLLEQRLLVRAWMDGFPDEIRAFCRVSGEYEDDLSRQLLLCGSEWLKDGLTVGAFYSETRGPRSVRLTVNGERAKADWQSGQIDVLLDFVRGITPRPPCPAEIALTNCETHPRTDLTPKEPTPAAPAAKPQRPKRRRRNADAKKLTPKQAEAVEAYADFNGDIPKAAKRCGISPRAMRDRLEGAWKKIGERPILNAIKAKTRRLPTDKRGQEVVFSNDEIVDFDE